LRCTSQIESSVRRQGYLHPAGVDEAGRGCLFGPVYAAAVILDPGRPITGLNDSKQLEPEAREGFALDVRQNAVCWAVATASPGEIDRLNIRQASRLAMRRAVSALRPACDYLLVDAMEIDWPVPQRALIKGDARVTAIAAASILAKVERDRAIVALDHLFPGYGLARHKGYPTEEHTAALQRLGPTPLHRRSYAPVREAMQLSVLW
jgi:ribonuclease HII